MPVEGRDLSSRQTQDVGKDRRLGNLSTPIRVQKLQKALHAKAKAEPDFRFYALYDKIYREDILAHAYAQCRSNVSGHFRPLFSSNQITLCCIAINSL